MTGRPERTRGAFTLLEILVAVAILGIVATTVAFVMGVGVEAWRAGAEMAEESHDGEGVMEQVVMALRSFSALSTPLLVTGAAAGRVGTACINLAPAKRLYSLPQHPHTTLPLRGNFLCPG